MPKSVYSKDEYPSYMSGAVYLTTTKTIAAILPRAAEIVAFHIDDALFTGILADLVNATRSLQKQHILRVDLVHIGIYFPRIKVSKCALHYVGGVM